MRARADGVGKRPCSNKRPPRLAVLNAGHCTGSSASYSLASIPDKSPMSKTRTPSFSNADKAACSENTSASCSCEKPAKPILRATSRMIRQSARASPGVGSTARCRERRRSEFVTVPDFSPQARAGRATSASFTVSVNASTSEITTRGHAARASRTRSASGIDTTGLVPMIQMALIRPSATASNISTAFKPGLSAMRS